MAHELLDLSQKLGVSETTIGTTIAAISLAAPEIILTWKAAHKGEKELAWGTIVGCSTATIGIVGGGLALSGAPIPDMLDPSTKEGLIHMVGFGGSTAAVLVASHPSINKSGRISKIVGAGFLAAYMTYLAATGGVSNGHRHTMPDGSKIYHGAPDKNSSQINSEQLKELPVLDLRN
jgi:Ca2+/Na+ antiporter